MLNKENPNYSTGTTKEEERKQYAKPGSKSEGVQSKPGNKPQQGKSQPGAKIGHKECSMNEEADDEECGSSFKSKSCD